MDEPDISLAEAITQSVIARTVSKEIFDREFGELKKRLEKQENQSFQVIIGVLIASVLILITIAVSVLLFVADFNQNILSAKQEFSDLNNNISEDNADLETSFLLELDELKGRQDYLESLLLEKNK